jgi:hypothetical protein
MADWGLYTALRGTDDWQTKRADAMMNFQMMQGLADKRKAENQERMEMEAKLNEYQESMRNLDVLKEDQERIRGVEKTSRQDIIAGIAKYDGDVKRFMSSGGVGILGEYKRAIQESSEYENAVENKQNMTLYLKDRADDMWIRPVDFEEEEIDEATGEKKKVKKKISMQDQIKMFENGQIQNLDYAGGEKKIKLDPKMFKGSYKNTNNPGAKDNYVSANDIFNAGTMLGSKEQAAEMAQTYGKNLKASGNIENAWRWKGPDIQKELDREQKQNQFEDVMDYKYWAARESSSSSSGSGGSGGSGSGGWKTNKNTIPAPFFTLGQQLKGGYGKTKGADAQISSPRLAEFFAQNTYDKRALVTKSGSDYINSDYDYSGNVSMIGGDGKIINFPMHQLGMELGHFGKTASFVNIRGEDFMTATVYGDPGGTGMFGSAPNFTQMLNDKDNNIAGAVKEYSDPTTAASGYMAEVLIPVSKWFDEANGTAWLDEKYNLSRKNEGRISTIADQDVQNARVKSGIYDVMHQVGGYNYGEDNSGMGLLNENN